MDLVGIEPTTSSMPWKRAPSCATGPFLRTRLCWCETFIIFAEVVAIVNAQAILARSERRCTGGFFLVGRFLPYLSTAEFCHN